jgi:hypothetical protein
MICVLQPCERWTFTYLLTGPVSVESGRSLPDSPYVDDRLRNSSSVEATIMMS